ncbi:MAG TPA: GNAT family N-acetyltransferase [Candidatus Caccenecus avistercoris]|nr:GNAT family N-acetyltransferase [Candidatus Caccenecus avistercoris]
MEIVKLESSQINNILDLRRAQELEKNYDPKLIDEYLDLFQSWLNEHLNKDFIMFGALEKNKLISMYGGVILPRPNATVIYLGSAYTLPEYRGQGLLTELNEKLFTFALEHGINMAEASIDSSTPEAMNHLTKEKMKAETNTHRYNLLLNPDYRFEEQNDRVNLINKDKNKYVISNNEDIMEAVVGIDHYIAHPLNPTGKTAMIDITLPPLTEDLLIEALKKIMNTYLQNGIYYFKIDAHNISTKALIKLGFKNELGAVHWNNIQNIYRSR